MGKIVLFPTRKRDSDEVAEIKKEILAIIDTKALTSKGVESTRYLFDGVKHTKAFFNRKLIRKNLTNGLAWTLSEIKFLRQQVHLYCDRYLADHNATATALNEDNNAILTMGFFDAKE